MLQVCTRCSKMSVLDEVDMKIIRMLAGNSRLSLREIARELGVAVSTVHARLRKLVSSGVIHRFTILPDYDALGYPITALILVMVEGRHIEEAARRLAEDPHVVAVYDITGDYDIAVIAKFKSIPELNAFIKSVNKLFYIKRTITSIALRVIKEDPTSPIISGSSIAVEKT